MPRSAAESPPQQVFCTDCGTSNDDTTSFCSNCGEPLAGTPVAAQQQQLLASRWTRLGAKIIDALVWLVPIIFVVIFYQVNDALGAISLLGFLAIPIVQVVLLSKDGQTIGKKVLDIRIVMVTTGDNGGFVPNVLLRAWLNALIGIFPHMGS